MRCVQWKVEKQVHVGLIINLAFFFRIFQVITITITNNKVLKLFP